MSEGNPLREIILGRKEFVRTLGVTEGFGWKVAALSSPPIESQDGETDNVHRSFTLRMSGLGSALL